MARLETLEGIEAALWHELARAPHDPAHAWRLAVLATTDGSAGEARHVVLRDVDAAQRLVVFYADSRAPKVAQLRAHPRATLVVWSAALAWQLRLKVHCEVQTSGLAVSSRWARLKLSPAAQDYLSPLAPGTPVEHPRPQRGSRDFFAIVEAHVEAVDWLELHADGHRRAEFAAGGRRWLSP
jgi:pyridoxamine 5'-phosphate oxidase